MPLRRRAECNSVSSTTFDDRGDDYLFGHLARMIFPAIRADT
jgi:hypothetical protein